MNVDVVYGKSIIKWLFAIDEITMRISKNVFQADLEVTEEKKALAVYHRALSGTRLYKSLIQTLPNVVLVDYCQLKLGLSRYGKQAWCNV